MVSAKIGCFKFLTFLHLAGIKRDITYDACAELTVFIKHPAPRLIVFCLIFKSFIGVLIDASRSS